MTKQLIALFAFAVIFFQPLFAEKVSVETAQKIAVNTLTRKSTATQSSLGVNSQKLQADATSVQLLYTGNSCNAASGRVFRSAQADSTAYFYVFGTKNNYGFVIVSADDRIMPVLGFSDTNGFSTENMPENVAHWLKEYAKQIQYVIEHNTEQTSELTKAWEEAQIEMSSIEKTAVVPLLLTQWNQYAPYNNLCPLDGENRSVTGCVATATAQIMKYYNHPTERTVTIPAYTTYSSDISVPDLGSATYDWANMKNTTAQYTTDEQKTAVATLMYHVGASVEMNYGANGSGAASLKVATALPTYFDYDADIRYKSRNYCNTTEWHNLLKTELDAGRPVYYAGDNENSGHAFVCDGYGTDDYFHFNWGWGGYCDGMFLTSALNPGTGGAGSGPGTYNLDQQIIYNIKPDEGGTSVGNYELGIRTVFTSTETQVQHNQSFTVSYDVINISAVGFPIGQIGVALVDNSDNIVAVIKTYNITGTLPAGYYYTSPFVINSCNVPSTVQAGTYTLHGVVKTSPDDGHGWYLIAAKNDGTGALPITVIGNCNIEVAANPPAGGTVSGGGNYTSGSSCTVSATANSGYTFIDWKEASSTVSTNADYTFTVSENRSLLANFTANTYTLTFDAEGGDVDPESKTVTYGEVVGDLPIPERTNYSFVGWYTEENGGGTEYSALTVFNEINNITLYAKWERLTYTITATSDNNGTISPSGLINIAAGDDITFVFTPNDGYETSQILIDEIPNLSAKEDGYYTFSNVTDNHVIATSFQLATGINDVNSAEIRLYPNPATDMLHIDIPFIENMEYLNIRILDISGRVLATTHLRIGERQGVRINVAHLSSGVYFLKIGDKRAKFMKK